MNRFLLGLIGMVLAGMNSAGASTGTSEEHMATGVTRGGNSRFQLLTLRCKGEEPEGPKATPQLPPLNVDDPATPGCNRWEINVVADGDLTPSQREYELLLLDINYGIGDNLQLKYEVPYSNTQSEGSRTARVGESKAGVKLLFFNDEAAGLEMAVYPQVTFIHLASDSASNKLQTMTTLPVLLTKSLAKTRLGEIDLTTNVAYTISKKSDTKDFLGVSVGVGLPLSHGVAAMGELASEHSFLADEDGRRASLVKANFGLVTTLSHRILIFGSVGHSLFASDGVSHQYALIGFRIMAGSGTPNDPVIASAR